MTRAGFPHSDISDSCACTRLVGAFRSVPRPSSALDAKASTVCPYLLYTCDTETRILLRFPFGVCVWCYSLLRLFLDVVNYVVVKLHPRPVGRWALHVEDLLRRLPSTLVDLRRRLRSLTC